MNQITDIKLRNVTLKKVLCEIVQTLSKYCNTSISSAEKLCFNLIKVTI